jgi:hypothetical protein
MNLRKIFRSVLGIGAAACFFAVGFDDDASISLSILNRNRMSA